MTMYSFQTQGVCARVINIELDGDIIKHVEFYGGCPGNLTAIPKLIAGRTVDEVDDLLRGIRCGNKATSCVDQMVLGMRAIQDYEREHANDGEPA